MHKLARWITQMILYALLAIVVGYFSTRPVYHHLGEDEALLRLSFRHPGKVLAECRRLKAEELAKIPANMRQELDCPRERSPVRVKLEMDGRAMHDVTYPPAGFSRDGASTGYWRQAVGAGSHRLLVQISDDQRSTAFAYVREHTAELRPGQVLLIDFSLDKGGIQIK